MSGLIGFIVWIVIGGLAGWVASLIMKTDAQQGVLMNVVVGIVGGLIGGFVLRLFGFSSGGHIVWTFLTSVIGAVALIWLVRAVSGRSV
ncbi:MAG: GlsB/YeaQ/YmgE family stress response membrane protein [Mycobacteriaceae bacterium]|nr:GlsB/YeaQ/YmgE family stress response membrane protein [Mycobacteriaceae bacterium]